jgi:flagellar assembly factor FliW
MSFSMLMMEVLFVVAVLDDGNLAFVIIEPLSFMFEYDIEISDADAGFITLERAEDAVLYVIVTIPANP